VDGKDGVEGIERSRREGLLDVVEELGIESLIRVVVWLRILLRRLLITYRDTDSIWEQSFEGNRHGCVVGSGGCGVCAKSRGKLKPRYRSRPK